MWLYMHALDTWYLWANGIYVINITGLQKNVLSKHKLLIKSSGSLPFNNTMWNIMNSALLKIPTSSLKEVFSKSSVLPHFYNAHSKHDRTSPKLDGCQQHWSNFLPVLACYSMFMVRFAYTTNFLSNWSSSGMEVTMAPFVNFSFSNFFFNLINVPISRFFDSHSYVKVITAAKLKWRLSNMNKIFEGWSMFW